MGSDVKEGFLCPICKLDLQSMNKLHSHFHEEHSEDIDIKKILKGVVGHARKIIKPNNNDVDDVFGKYVAAKKDVLRGLEIYNVTQEIGVRRSHMCFFKEIRDQRLEGFSAETNKLIIRLDKLLTNVPSDPSRKKLHEQTVVQWLDEEDVSRCPECTKTFHLTRRKHHCRLCGSIMCNDCSSFLTLWKAKKMLASTNEENTTTTNGCDSVTADSLRVCRYCLKSLESRESMKANRNCNPPLSQLYEQIRMKLKDIDSDMDMYNDMSLSLNEGKSTFHLGDAANLWEKIMKLSEKIALMSGKIASLGTADLPMVLSEKELKLRKAVGIGISGYIQSRILALPTLPSEEVYENLQQSRRKKVEEEIREQQREEVTNSFLSNHVMTEYVHSKPNFDKMRQNVSLNESWIPDVSNMRYNDNPIIQQMDNIRGYIKQAREAYKFDEVASLESHLRELQEEFYRRQQQS